MKGILIFSVLTRTQILHTENFVRKIQFFVKSVLTGQKTDMEHRSVCIYLLDKQYFQMAADI